MPAPATYEYSAAVVIAANTALLAEIDAGAAAAKLKLYDNSDTLLATITLSDPAGTVNGTTGQLTITAPAAVSVGTTGTCTYGTITDSDDTVIVSIPAQSGSSAVSGQIVISTTSLVSGADVELVSCVIG